MKSQIKKDGLVEAFIYDDPNKIIDTLAGPIKYISYLRKMQKQINARKGGFAYLDEQKRKCGLLVYDNSEDKTIKCKNLPTDVQV